MTSPFRFAPEISSAIRLAALTSGLDQNLLAAVVWQESRGRRRAVRYEEEFRWMWDVVLAKPFRRLTDEERSSDTPPADFHGAVGASPQDEWCGQRTSWGLCQVMGATARQLGYQGASFYGLWDAAVGLDLGGLYLARLIAKWDQSDAISAYNAGSPSEANEATYVRPVLRQMAIFEKDGF